MLSFQRQIQKLNVVGKATCHLQRSFLQTNLVLEYVNVVLTTFLLINEDKIFFLINKIRHSFITYNQDRDYL